ncbi:MAG: hypothetical protein M0Q19_09115 [Candidatus Cloacimonetes bacterium]|jgi:hypothetical protein|nr:hypothetical protein [Candidatus Cloacimonadota bacterium]MDY3203144.1 hypothetical protein [Methanocorpusculum sp.]
MSNKHYTQNHVGTTTTVFDFVRGKSPRERRIHDLKVEQFDLKIRNNELLRELQEIIAELKEKKEERDQLLKMGEDDPTMRDDILTDLKFTEAAISRIEEKKIICQHTREINMADMIDTEDELDLLTGNRYTRKELEEKKDTSSANRIRKDEYSSNLEKTVRGRTSNPSIIPHGNRSLHNDVYSKEIMKYWEQSDARKGIGITNANSTEVCSVTRE